MGQMTKAKVALGMSGGVDSSLAAHLLVETGYEVTGVYLECWRAPGCRTEQDRADALKVALALDIPFQVLDFKQAYKDRVVEYFFAEYQAGRTPNPDILCNQEIKFGLFYDWALSQGFSAIATGHYAATDEQHLFIPQDQHKDQTYFLYRLQQAQLAHILFPLGQLTKSEVREQAKQRGIHVAAKKDSVGICFIGDIDVHQFLLDRLGENPGTVVDTAGNIIGRHRGLWFYTVGQRHGFDIDKQSVILQQDGTTLVKENLPPFYVVKKLPLTNQLVVGFGAQTQTSHFLVNDLHWIAGSPPPTKSQVLVRIRHTGQLQPAIINNDDQHLVVDLHQALSGVAAGQSAVFYQQQKKRLVCLGGGVIE